MIRCKISTLPRLVFIGLCSLFLVFSCQKDEADITISEEIVDYDQAVIQSRSVLDDNPCGDIISAPDEAESEYINLDAIFTDDVVQFDLEVARDDTDDGSARESDGLRTYNRGGGKDKKIKTKKIKVKAYRNVDGRFFFAIIKRHGEKKEMVSLIRDESASGRSALSANTVDLQQDLMMISDLTTTESNYDELVEGLPDNYTVEIEGGTIRFVEDSDPVNDPVEEIATVEDCVDQKVNSSMAAIGIGSQYFNTWKEAMQLCGNDICSPQCVEAVAAVPYMFGTRTDLDLNTTTNLMIFYLGSTAGISAEQATWLRGSTLTLTSVYQYLLSRDTELDCGYKSETGIAGRIAGAFIDERVALMIPATIDDFACTIEDYFYCVRDDYSRAELAFNAAMDVYEQYGSTCSMCAGTLSARGSVCPCDEEPDVIADIMACTGASTDGANDILDIIGSQCDNASDYCKCVNTIVLTTCISQNKFHLVQNAEFDPEWGAWQGLANFRPTDPRVTSRLEQLDWELQTIDQANGPIVNLDYFAVKITQLPLVNGQQATPSEVFEDIRLRFLDFDDGCNSTFAFADNVDAQTWQSNDAIPSAFRIDILNDGNVICGQYDFGCCWTFSTVEAQRGTDSGLHPVSGNRQFGLRVSSDGSGWEFYARGADRFRFIDPTFFISEVVYTGGDFLWSCLMQNVADYINVSGQTTSSNIAKSYRPAWFLIPDFLSGQNTTSELNCFE